VLSERTPIVHFTNTITGQGGLWLDTSGGTPWSAVDAATSHWNLLPHATADWRPLATGSFATTSHFHLGAHQAVTVDATLLTAHVQPFNDVGFALLLSGSLVKAVLFARRPDNNVEWGDQGPPQELTFAETSASVNLTPTAVGAPVVQLGTVPYGSLIDTSSCVGNNGCACQLTAVCTPGAGSYSLLFGMFGIPAGGPRPAAMIASFSH
jgi:hypothetical protein